MSKFKDTRYQWNRPSFNIGDRYPVKHAPDIPIRFSFKYADTRDKLNRNETNFYATKIQGRNLESFEDLKSLNEELYGKPVQISMTPFKMEIADSDDTTWINEYNRRRQAGETDNQILSDPPFGRQQKTVNTVVDFNTLARNVSESFRVMSSIVNKHNVDDSSIQNIIVPSFISTLGGLPEDSKIDSRTIADINKINNNIGRYTTRDFDTLGLAPSYLLSNMVKSKLDQTLRGNMIKYLIDVARTETGGDFYPDQTPLATHIDDKNNVFQLTYDDLFGAGKTLKNRYGVRKSKADFILNVQQREVVVRDPFQGIAVQPGLFEKEEKGEFKLYDI